MGRRGKASPSSARLAGVVAVAILPLAAVIAVCVASKDIVEGVVCASLCVRGSRLPRFPASENCGRAKEVSISSLVLPRNSRFPVHQEPVVPPVLRLFDAHTPVRLRHSFTMYNEEGENIELYIPRKCSWTNRLIEAKDHAAVQINVGHLDQSGVYNGQYTTLALSGYVRNMVRNDTQA